MMSEMTESQKFIHVSKYSRWIEAENRRELSWKETADRYLNFMRGKFGTVVPKKVWQTSEQHLYSLGVVPSMRAVATAGEALESNNILAYNCSFVPFGDLRAVWELFYILMCGTGVGFSVENHWTKQMPAVKRWNGDGAGVWVVEDSSEGWAKSLEAGLEAWFDGKDIEFDYSKIRPRGVRLRTKGGRASGPEPLMRLHTFCREQISKAQGRQLTSVEWLDIGNVIADVVIVGGVRRSSEICFSDLDDVTMREAKDWSKGIPGYRANSNNSAVYFTKPDAATFLREWGHLVESCAGERGIFNLHAAKQMLPERRKFSWEMRTNPCGEVLLKPFQFCVSYDTPLITPDALVTIGESVGKEIEVWNGLGWRRVTPRKTGSGRKLYRVRLSDGSFLDCTDNHGFSVKTRFQKTFSRVEAKDLMDYSKHPLQLEPTVITFGGGRKIENAYTLGFVVGDGHVVYGEKDTHQDHVYCILYGDKMECPVEGGRGTISVKTGYNVPSVTVDCTQVLHGMADRISELKSNPAALNELFSWSRESVLNFVAGLADSDGSETTTGGIRVYVSQEARARKLQLLLSKSGIRSSVNLMSKKGETTNCGTRNEDIWYLQITDCSNIPCHRLDTSQGHAAKFKGKYQNVVSVTELPGVHDTYCFEEPERHMAVFGNVLTYQCNLSEVIVRANDDFDKLVEKVGVAVWFGAMQASLTKFPLLRKEFEKNCKEEALLGVSLTGQMDNPKLMTPEKLAILKAFAIKTAKKASATLGINMAAAVTCGKPSGCRPWDALTTTQDGILTLQELLAISEHPVGAEWSAPMKRGRVIQNNHSVPIAKTYANGKKEVFRTTLSYGLTLDSTANHQWAVNGEWKRTDELKAGDRLDVEVGSYRNTIHSKLEPITSLAIHMREPEFHLKQPSSMNEELAWMLGYLWGDGAMSPAKYRIRFIDENTYNLEKVQRILLEQFGLDSTVHPASEGKRAWTLEVGSKLLWHWLIKNGVWKYFAENIDIVPLCVRTSSRNDIVAFIAGLLDSDGWVGEKNGSGNFTITTANELFSRHLQHLSWAVGLPLGRSLNSVGENYQGHKQMFLMGAASAYLQRDSFDALARNSNKASRWSGGWLWDRPIKHVRKAGVVSAVESIGFADTYDIEVDGEPWYLNGAIKSHNTVSQLTNAASGAHPTFAEHYIRRYRLNATDPCYRLMKAQGVKFSPENDQGPESIAEKRKALVAKGHSEASAKKLVPDWDESQVRTWVCEFPMAGPKGAITRSKVTAIDQLEWYLKVQKNWCEHNQSITVYVRDDEWLKVGAWIYDHFDEIVGVTCLPYDGGSYKQMPFEEITEEQYKEMVKKFPKLDWTVLPQFEHDDQTTGAQLLSCTAGNCEV